MRARHGGDPLPAGGPGTSGPGTSGPGIAGSDTAGPGAAGSDTATLGARLAALDDALRRAEGRLAPDVAERARIALDRVRARLALGVDHTVVALAGGTGSGKSSLFNKISGLGFADVGARRPTTSQVSACVWGAPAEGLLDWLGVARDRRIARESELDADREAPLRGIVLLDLPDHDSVEADHRAVVEELLPQADLLVWVVDPQKYADDALHSRYLRTLQGHEASMMVLLNQVDTVPDEAVGELVRDIVRLLAEDGLTGVPVHAVSARTGTGIPEMRERLAEVASRRTMAAGRVAAELADVARLLAGEVGPDEPPLEGAAATATDGLAEAAGLPALTEAVAAAARSGRRAPVPGPLHAQSVEVVRDRWVADVGQSLPAGWRAAIDRSVPTPTDIREAATEALRALRVTAARSRAAVSLRVLAVLAAAGAVALAAVTAGEWLGPGFDAFRLGESRTAQITLGLLLGAVLLAVVGGAVQRRSARRRAHRLDRDARGVLADVVRRFLVEPTAAVLEDHRAVRTVVTAAEPVAPSGSAVTAPVPT